MVGQINHLANCQNEVFTEATYYEAVTEATYYEAVTDTYFFLKKSYMANTTHTMPMPAKNKPTKLAHHASAAMLSIQFGQLQAQGVHCMCNQCSCSI